MRSPDAQGNGFFVGLLTATLLLQVVYAIGTATSPSPFFGINQFSHFLSTPIAITLLFATWIVAHFRGGAMWARIAGHSSPRLPALGGAFGVAVGSGVLFMVLRSNHLNPDGMALLETMPQEVLLHGAHVTHDEMLELYAHSRFYFYSHRAFGWSVMQSYQSLVAVAGAAFVFMLALIAQRQPRGTRFMFAALILAGGWVQVFFGDVENYGLVTPLILLFFIASFRSLEGRIRSWIPAVLLSLAMSFHLVAGLFLPALAFVLYQERERPGALGIAGLGLVLPLCAVLGYFHFHGLPIQLLFTNSQVSGMGGHYGRYVAPLWRLRYLGGILNDLVLLVPIIVALPVLIIIGRLRTDRESRFLQIAAATALLFLFTWKAQLGVYQDWNLYAPAAVPIALLVAKGLSESIDLERNRLQVRVLLLTAAAHSLAWILWNHVGRC